MAPRPRGSERLKLTGCLPVERPLAPSPRSNQVYGQADQNDYRRVSDLFLKIRPRKQDIEEACQRDYRGYGIEPHKTRPRQIGPPDPEHYDADYLRQKLNDYPDDYEGCYHISQPQKTEEGGHPAHHQQRDIRELMPGVDPPEDLEIVAVEGR